ncbi:tRNA-specific adenosine deaminase [Clostridia bacterium]|nr:tRNA-specific adenosine deaminase [Clostridia bacterium]
MLSKERMNALIRIAMEEADAAVERGDDPYGGAIVDQEGNIFVRNGNRQNTEQNPAAHAEMVLIREAAKKLGSNDLSGYISVCNAESCPMCASALVIAGIKEFYFGAWFEDGFQPNIQMSVVKDACYDNIILEGGILANECSAGIKRGREKLSKNV